MDNCYPERRHSLSLSLTMDGIVRYVHAMGCEGQTHINIERATCKGIK